MPLTLLTGLTRFYNRIFWAISVGPFIHYIFTQLKRQLVFLNDSTWSRMSVKCFSDLHVRSLYRRRKKHTLLVM